MGALLIFPKLQYLKNEAQILLSGEAELSFFSDKNADITLIDVDTEKESDLYGTVIRLSRTPGKGDAVIPLPFSFFTSLTRGTRTARLTVNDSARCCYFDRKEIKLTAHEYKLLSLLVSRDGEFVGRREISESVFDGGNDNLINIYVHYLREKLENGSNKIIISSRKHGYAVNKDFLGGKIC